MSVIAGIFALDGAPVPETTVRKMTAVAADIGPDSETFHVGRDAGLGHRLSRFTKEDLFERQPLMSRDGRIALICAARIDNRPELAETLAISDAAAARMPDSEFVLAAYEKWGDDFAGHLVGSFAIAINNDRDRTLLLVRSPGGEHSVYYYSDRHFLFFGSAPRTLFATGAVPREVNPEKAADFLVTLPSEEGSCWYRGMESLAPGHALSISQGRRRMWRYWRPDPDHKIRYSRDSDYVEAFVALWQRVVSDHLRSRTIPGIMMSGGLDSTAVGATTALELAKRGERLTAFTEVPPDNVDPRVIPGRYADESPYVQSMARRFPNLDVNLIATPSEFFLDGVEKWFRAAESPFRNAYNRLWWHSILANAASKGIPVLLTGLGGNLTISWAGDPLITQLLLQGRWLRALREAQSLAANGTCSSAWSAVARGLSPLLPDSLWLALHRHRYPGNPVFSASPPWTAYSLIRPEFAREQQIDARAQEIGHSFQSRPSRDGRSKTLLRTDVQGDYRRGELSLHGVEVRSPAEDRRIVEFCLAVPEDQFRRDGTSKWLLRRAMKDVLPEEILNNRRRGLQAANWLDQLLAGSQALREVECLERSDLASHVLDLPRMKKLLYSLPHEVATAGKYSVNYQAMLGIGLMTGRFLRWTETGQ